MNSKERVSIIQERLQKAFEPAELKIIDDGKEHVGHAGSKDGAGHYTVLISSENFKEKTRVEIHREIYNVLNDLIPQEIHALRIKVI